MKRCILILICLLSILSVSARAQETVLEEISEMKHVEVVYISSSMLKSLQSNNASIAGFATSSLADDLSSLQILTVDDKSVAKAREKLKTVDKKYNMEVVMKLKENDTRTDMYAIRTPNKSYFSKLLTIVDEGKKITVIYMTGKVGMNTLNALTRRNKIGKNGHASIINIDSYKMLDRLGCSSVEFADNGSDNKNNNIQWSVSKLDLTGTKSLAGVEKGLDNINKQLECYNDSIDNLGKQIAKCGNDYTKRSTLYEKRSRLYEIRNSLYGLRNDLKRLHNDLKYGYTSSEN